MKPSEAYQILFETMAQGVVWQDAAGRITSANPAAERILGLTLAQMQGRTSLDPRWRTVRENGAPLAGHDHPSMRALRTGEPVLNEILGVYNPAEDALRWLLVSATPIAQDGAPGPQAVFTTFDDVTALRNKDRELAALEAQLRQAQKMEAVGQLAGGVAHDFNNVLTAIIGCGRAALAAIGPGHAARDDVVQILAAAERASRLTRDLLAFGRREVLTRGPVSVNAVVESAAKLLARALGENVRIALRLAEADTTVDGDAGLLEQVLVNLATNARDAMPAGGALEIATEVCPAGGPPARVRLVVKDHGVGMDGPTLQRAFEPFFTTKAPGEGTGLGLAMVYGIVEQHGGTITVESVVGRGTTFFIDLPASAVVAAAARPPPRAPEAAAGRGETVLLAEDEEVVRALMGRMLRQAGYAVVEASDGAEAIEAFRAMPAVDLLLLDLVMPRANGRDVLEAARQLNPSVRTIFMSGYPLGSIARFGWLDPGAHYVSKPVGPEELLAKIREVLDAPARAPGEGAAKAAPG
jgi:PAS domain S-box-containing protein